MTCVTFKYVYVVVTLVKALLNNRCTQYWLTPTPFCKLRKICKIKVWGWGWHDGVGTSVYMNMWFLVHKNQGFISFHFSPIRFHTKLALYCHFLVQLPNKKEINGSIWRKISTYESVWIQMINNDAKFTKRSVPIADCGIYVAWLWFPSKEGGQIL